MGSEEQVRNKGAVCWAVAVPCEENFRTAGWLVSLLMVLAFQTDFKILFGLEIFFTFS